MNFKPIIIQIIGTFAFIALIIIVLGLMYKPEGHELTAYGVSRNYSTYVEMPDGVKVAIDVWLPAGISKDQKIPTLIKGTPYWRAHQLTFLGKAFGTLGINANPIEPDIPLLNKRGYAVIIVDARGTGASFGVQNISYDDSEMDDYDEVINWAASQAWSNGNVGAYGSCYRGVTAARMAAYANPSLKAVAPLYDMSDWFLTSYPGGAFGAHLAGSWAEFATGLNSGIPRCKNALCRLAVAGPKPVDDDKNNQLLQQAIIAHSQNFDVQRCVQATGARDVLVCDSGKTMTDVSTISRKKAIEQADIPLYVQVGYFDGSSPSQTVRRFQEFSNPQEVIMGPMSHGGFHDTDQFKAADAKPELSFAKQTNMMADFFDKYLLDKPQVPQASSIKYYVSGAGESLWKETNVWPPANVRMTPWYFGAENSLSAVVPNTEDGMDEYRVDFSASTGTLSRHRSQVDFSKTAFPDRAQQAKRLLTYTSAPMESDMDMTGDPVARLQLSSTHDDGVVIVYLENVSPEGKVTYLTEGVLRLAHRKLTKNIPATLSTDPFHTYLKGDMMLMKPGQVEEVVLALAPLSVRIQQGHRLRVSIAGADNGNIQRIPEGGNPTLAVQRNKTSFSSIELPIVMVQ